MKEETAVPEVLIVMDEDGALKELACRGGMVNIRLIDKNNPVAEVTEIFLHNDPENFNKVEAEALGAPSHEDEEA